MENIYDYLDKYGNKTFDEVEYTEIDNLVFTQISYLNFNNIVSFNEDKIKLNDAYNKFITKKYKHVSRKRLNIFKTIKDMKRYKDLLLSNYIYKLTEEEQFGALSIDINENLRCVVFEGTDDTIVGWKEDFTMSYLSIIPSAKDATNYLNKVSKYTKKLIITGHSKGGYLSLISAMNSNLFTKMKIEKIYSLDGPGIKKEELNSRKFNSIKNKYIKIIPKCSIIGRLFYDIDNPIICDAKAIGLLGHSVFTWVLEDKQFKRSELTKFSIDLDNNFTSWIESYSEDEIKYFCNYIFLLLDRFNFKMTYDLKNIDSNTYLEILKYIKNTDPKVKKMLEEFLSFIKAYYKDDIGKKISPIFSIYDKLRSKEI